jgi:hypothetical protein
VLHPEAASLVPLAPARHREVDRDDERLVAVLARLRDEVEGDPAVPEDVELEPPPCVRRGGRDVGDAGRRLRRQHEGRVGGSRGPSHGRLAVGVRVLLVGHRRDDDRVRHLPAQHRHRRVTLADVDEHPRQQREPRPRRVVVAQGDLVARAAGEVAVRPFTQQRDEFLLVHAVTLPAGDLCT